MAERVPAHRPTGGLALVTGADGLLGANVTRALRAHGQDVRAMVQPGSRATTLDGLDVEIARADLRDPAAVTAAISGIDVIVHCAALADPRASAALLHAVNVLGTRNVLDAALAKGARRLIHVGSASSLGFGPAGRPGTEEDDFPPAYRDFAYALSKHRAMALVERCVAERGLDALTVAPTFMLGAHDSRPSSGELVLRFVRGGMPLVSPGGRSFVHVSDVAEAIVAALDRGRAGRRYLLAGHNLSYRAFFTELAGIVGKAPPIATLPAAVVRGVGWGGSAFERLTGRPVALDRSLAGLACQHAWYSPARAIAELGMKQTPLRTALTDCLAGLRRHGHLPGSGELSAVSPQPRGRPRAPRARRGPNAGHLNASTTKDQAGREERS